MANKETLQSYNARLNNNNVDLNSILETINNLPSGSDIEDSFMIGTITHYCNDRITLTSQYCLAGRNNLISIELPNVTELQTRACFMCSKLETIELDSIERFYSGVFYGDTSLKSVIIRTPSVATLVASDVFSNSAIASGTGYVYVPDNLVNSYKVATNWSTYANQIKGLSELN